MKNIFKTLAIAATVAVAGLATSGCCSNPYTGDYALKNRVDSFSYALGYFEGKGLRDMFATRTPFDTVDYKCLSAAFAKSGVKDEYLTMRKGQFDTLAVEAYLYGFNNTLLFGKCGIEEMRADMLLRQQSDSVRARQERERKLLAEKSLVEGQAFLKANAQKDSVVCTESGLQYKVIKKGEGKTATENDRVKVLYTGKLLDGTVFDSTAKRDNKPATFGVRGVVKGWQEALTMMPEGSKWELYIPSELGYGERGNQVIPGNSVLVFEVEVIEVIPAKK